MRGIPVSRPGGVVAAPDDDELSRLTVGTPSVKKITLSGSTDCTVPSALRNMRKTASSQLVLPPERRPATARLAAVTSAGTTPVRLTRAALRTVTLMLMRAPTPPRL